METYKAKLDYYLKKAEQTARQFFDRTANVLYPGQDPTIDEVLANMPERYIELMGPAPCDKSELFDRAYSGWQIHRACNFLERKKLLPDIEGLNQEEQKMAYRFFMAGVYFGILDTDGKDYALFEALKRIFHGEGQSWARKNGWSTRNALGTAAAQNAISWMLERWGKGEEADHATFARYVYYEKPKFGLQNKISLPKFRSLVKKAAIEHFPHKVRGRKKPPAL